MVIDAGFHDLPSYSIAIQTRRVGLERSSALHSIFADRQLTDLALRNPPRDLRCDGVSIPLLQFSNTGFLAGPRLLCQSPTGGESATISKYVFKVRCHTPLFRQHLHFLQHNSMFERSSVRSTIPRTPSVPMIRSPHFSVARSGFILAAIALDTVPVLAHNVKTDADVGATFHIEPDHNPRAGETARAWFALTREGGELIPLAKCDCLLAVYDRAISETEPILTPTLQAIAAEEFRDIPGADIVFPQAGAYELEISGSPKEGESFSPFSLAYSVTVTPGTTPVASPATEANTTDETTPRSPSTTTNSTPSWGVPAIAIVILVVAGGFWWALKQFKSKES